MVSSILFLLQEWHVKNWGAKLPSPPSCFPASGNLLPGVPGVPLSGHAVALVDYLETTALGESLRIGAHVLWTWRWGSGEGRSCGGGHRELGISGAKQGTTSAPPPHKIPEVRSLPYNTNSQPCKPKAQAHQLPGRGVLDMRRSAGSVDLIDSVQVTVCLSGDEWKPRSQSSRAPKVQGRSCLSSTAVINEGDSTFPVDHTP
jgi:hypothetical protein